MRIWSDHAQHKAALTILAAAVLLALLLALPGQTVTTKYLNDLLIFLEGAHRIDAGQAPNRDFHTALGPLNFYLPALGAWIGGSLGAAMPVGMALLVVLVALPLAHVASSRMRPTIAIPVSIFLLVVLAMPANLGEAVTDLSFAMFYNRVGWAALGALLLMHLRPSEPRRGQTILDAGSAGLLTLVLIYTKASFGAVALAFLVLMLLDREQRRWAALAIAGVAVAGLLIEVLWGGTRGQIQDLMLASQVSGTLRDPRTFAEFVLRNLADYVLFGLVAGLALWRSRSFRDFLFFGLCAGAGLVLIGQNFQNWGIISLHAGAAVGAETLARRMRPMEPARAWSPAAAAPLLLLALVLPTIVHGTATVALHGTLAAARAGEPIGLPRMEGVRLAHVWRDDDFRSHTRYVATLREGADLLQEMGNDASKVFVLDFVSPFSSGLGLEPPRGDTAWLHWGRTLDDKFHLPPEKVLEDVRVVMEPKVAIEGITADNLRLIFGPYIDENYELVRETEFWKVYVSRAWRERNGPRSAQARTGASDGER